MEELIGYLEEPDFNYQEEFHKSVVVVGIPEKHITYYNACDHTDHDKLSDFLYGYIGKKVKITIEEVVEGGQKMKLFQLCAKLIDKGEPPAEWPWFDEYDGVYTLFCRAEDEADARKFASTCHGSEGPEPWLDPRFTICVELTPEGPPGVICPVPAIFEE